jgi:hypothetical protein
MKSVNEDKSLSVAANKDRGFLPNLQHALGDLADSLRPEAIGKVSRLSMSLTCSAVILTTNTLRNVGDMKIRRVYLHAPGHRCWRQFILPS